MNPPLKKKKKNKKKTQTNKLTYEPMTICVKLNLINCFVGFILCQFACNSTFRNPVFRWESCKGSV